MLFSFKIAMSSRDLDNSTTFSTVGQHWTSENLKTFFRMKDLRVMGINDGLADHLLHGSQQYQTNPQRKKS